MSKSEKIKEDYLDAILKNNPHISAERMQKLKKIQKKLGLNMEPGANYTLGHPFERIQIDPNKPPLRGPFNYSPQIFTNIFKNKL